MNAQLDKLSDETGEIDFTEWSHEELALFIRTFEQVFDEDSAREAPVIVTDADLMATIMCIVDGNVDELNRFTVDTDTTCGDRLIGFTWQTDMHIFVVYNGGRLYDAFFNRHNIFTCVLTESFAIGI
jgi:hypothetical protein